MISKQVEIERFSVISSKPFEAVLAAINTAVGNPTYPSSVGRSKRHERSLNSKMSFEEPGRDGTDDIRGTRPGGDSPQGERARYAENGPSCDWESIDHERDG